MLKTADNELLTQTDLGTPMGRLFRSFWIPALLSAELPAADCPPVRVRLLGTPLVAFRDSAGRIGVLDEACPHRTASLFFGRNEHSGLRCTYHGWKFDINGTCLDMPNEPPDSDFKNKVQAGAYPAREQGGVVWVYLGAPAGEPTPAQLPELEWSRLPSDRCYITKVLVDCNYLQAMEGDLDSSHSAFLHSRPDDSIDRAGATKVRQEELRRYSFADKAPRFYTIQTDAGLMLGARRVADEDNYYWRITQWMLPSYSLMPREDESLRQCNMRVPIDDEHHWF
jgi:phthalate 4,5-dioxygenase